MVAHFNISDSSHSFYFVISSIRQVADGLFISGTVGDGSAECLFEATLGGTHQVQILPVWDADAEGLCQRYEQSQLEQALSKSLEDVCFRSEGLFDSVSGCWQQYYVAEPKSSSICFPQPERQRRPHPYVHESGPVWQQRLSDSGLKS